VLRIYIRALLSFYRRRACKAGVRNGRSGAVTFIQRFGATAHLNVHFHVIALDGVFVADEAGKLAFHAADGPKPGFPWDGAVDGGVAELSVGTTFPPPSAATRTQASTT
jgi:hypothetical protein